MKNTVSTMKKNRLQQQTLDRFFKPSSAPRQPLPTVSPTALSSHDIINVDEEAMNEVLHSSTPAPTTAAAAAAGAPPPPRDEVWRTGQLEVILPWSPLHTRAGANGARFYVWDRIRGVLSEPFRVASPEDLCSLLAALDQLVDGPGNGFVPLRRALGKLSAVEQRHLYDDVLPWMKAMVLQAPTLFEGRTVPLLVQGETRRAVFSHEEVVALMCCGFFSLFPQRSEAKKSAGRDGEHAAASRLAPSTAASSASGGGGRTRWLSRKLPCINFSSLFSCGAVGRDASLDSKIRAFVEYFFCCHRHHSNPLSVAHQRCLELTRASCTTFPRFEESTQVLSAVEMRRTGRIEDDAGALQVDFANRFVGGGVLRSGCVQEEIRMALAPEMVLSRLVCEELTESEVLFISGAPDFCTATGYGEHFRFSQGCDPWASAGDDEEDSQSRAPHLVPPLVVANATQPRTKEPMLIHNVCVLAMDAKNFRVSGRPSDQYQPPYLRRELHKAYVGFHGVPETYATLPLVRTGAIATGHWGCGAFRGDKELKLLLQWCAAAEAGNRALHYYTFETPLSDFDALQTAVVAAGWTVGTMTRALLRYGEYRSKVPEGEAMRPFQFVAQVCAAPS